MRPDRSCEPAGALEQHCGHDTEQEKAGELHELEVRDREHERRRNDCETDSEVVMRRLHVTDPAIQKAPIDNLLGERSHDRSHDDEGEHVDQAVDVGNKIFGGLTDVSSISDEPYEFVQRYEDELGGDTDPETEWHVDGLHCPAEITTPVEAVATIEERYADEADPQRKIQKRQNEPGRAQIIEGKVLAELHRSAASFSTDCSADIETPSLGCNDRTADEDRQEQAASESDEGEHDQPRWRVRLRLLHLTGVAKDDRLDRLDQNLGIGGGRSAVTQCPSPRRVGAVGMAATEIVVGRTVERMQRIKPDLPAAVVERQGRVGTLTATGAGTSTAHSRTVTSTLVSCAEPGSEPTQRVRARHR